VSNRNATLAASALAPDTRTAKGVFAKAVGAFVPKVTAAVFQKFGFHSAEIMASWSTIVGPDIARLTRPESIKWPRGKASVDGEDAERGGGTLVIATEPAFALEISYRHKEIIDRINRYFGYRAIGQLKVHQVPSAAASTPAARAIEKRAEKSSDAGALDLMGALDALGQSVSAARAR
jgi:hypothetical protein